MNAPASTSRVLIVGAGFGGITLGVELLRSGIRDFVILEKAGTVGGVWRANTYPGAGCDVPSPLYSFSFAPNPAWPRRYAAQPDIRDYLERVAREYGVFDHIRFDTEVAGAEFHRETGRWEITTTGGERHRATVFVPAAGQLARPALPPIPGRHRFRGRSFHSAEWEHSCDLTGKRVAVIGTGASAIQFVPRIQPRAGRLLVFQRSAQYIMPKRDHAYKPWHHQAFRSLPAIQQLDRLGFWMYAEFAQQCMSEWQRFIPLFAWQARRHLRRKVADPGLRRKLTPDYQIGCKRVLFSNDYLPALTRDNVTLHTESITEITESGIRTADGRHHDADVIIYGTGFAALDLLAPMRITGRDGHALADSWRAGARAHLGLSVPGFPNMFVLYGPNTNLGGGSIVYMLESQARYVRAAVHHVADGTAEVLPRAEAAWDAEIQHRLSRSVWTRCSSWYRNAHGRVVANWPGRTAEYRRRTRRFDAENYRVTTPE